MKSAFVSLILTSMMKCADYNIYECTTPNAFAMTFDDGPHTYTSELLNILGHNGVKATFFIVGEMVSGKAARNLKRMVNEGHQIAIHTYTHSNINEMSDDQLTVELERTRRAISRVSRVNPKYMRCPFGECNEQKQLFINQKGYKVVNWNLDTNDWQTKNTQKTIQFYQDNIPQASGNSFISLQHDIYSETVKAVPQLIKIVKERGYTFMTVAQCLGDSPY